MDPYIDMKKTWRFPHNLKKTVHLSIIMTPIPFFKLCVSFVHASSSCLFFCAISHLQTDYDTVWPTVISQSGRFPCGQWNSTQHILPPVHHCRCIYEGGGLRGADTPPRPSGQSLPGKSGKFTPPFKKKSCKILKIWKSKRYGQVAWKNEASVPERHFYSFYLKWVLIITYIRQKNWEK